MDEKCKICETESYKMNDTNNTNNIKIPHKIGIFHGYYYKEDADKITMEYYKKCCEYLKVVPSENIDINTVIEAHEKHNDKLLRERYKKLTFPGCRNCECDKCNKYIECVWRYGNKRCDCGNQRFDFTYEDVNWLKDTKINSWKYVGTWTFC